MSRRGSHKSSFSMDERILFAKSLSLRTLSPSSVPKRSSSIYHGINKSGRSSIRSLSFKSGTATEILLPSATPITPPSRISSLQFYTAPTTPQRKATDPIPFPLKPSPIAKTTPASASTSLERSRVRKVNPYLTPPTSPDRFVPTRRSKDGLVKSYRLSKAPCQLSPSERVMRHRSASQDPFRRQRPRAAPTTNRPNLTHINTRPIRQGTFGILPSPRAASTGAIWNVGRTMPSAAPGPPIGIPNGRGGVVSSGTNAPMFTSDFLNPDAEKQSNERFEGRLAAALEIDQTTRVLNFTLPPKLPPRFSPRGIKSNVISPDVQWKDNQWVPDSSGPYVLDAPLLRDDFYCSILAYCATSKTLAVGLRNRVYLWSEASGVTYPPRQETDRRNTYVSSLSFSSTNGENSILAVGRSNGKMTLWSLHDEEDRCEWHQENAIACVAFKPVTTKRASVHTGQTIEAEELLVGDEVGTIFYYSIEWTRCPDQLRGSECISMLAKIDIHTQQICGIAWSHDGELFASGGNDNVCLLFSVREVLAPVAPQPLPGRRTTPPYLAGSMTGMIPAFIPNAPTHVTLGSMLHTPFIPPNLSHVAAPIPTSSPPRLPRILHLTPTPPARAPLHIRAGREMHKWTHSAAVKAIAFCPWQRGLVATGGGSNDRAIHFFHAWSGACLATINVQAQVTSLIWSNTRREIAATFGYAQPEHQFRIAVFSWPDCQQVVAIPWTGDLRALYAVAYPGGPNERGATRSGEGERWWRRTAEEGCLVVASSDESVKFHEVWSGGKRATKFGVGGLGWSDILEGLEGIDKEGDVIR